MKKAMTSCWLLPLAALGCGVDDPTGLELDYDHGTLSEYRNALPSEERLVVAVPTAASDGSMQYANPAAVLAGQGVLFARGVNETARDIAHTLHTLAAEAPDSYSPTRERFRWGPWRNPTGRGEMALEIRRTPEAEHELSYELARQMPDRPETRVVVLWGAGTPDREDPTRSSGYTALDLDANTAFELDNGGSREALIGQGRFVIAYGHTLRADASVHFNLAAFRGFIPPSEGSDSELMPVSVDHFYGRVAEPSGTVVDFLQASIEQDLCDAAPESCFESEPGSHPERLAFGEFFVDSGLGRADVSLSGGDLANQLQLSECWNASLTRTSYRMTTSGSDQQMMPQATCPGRAAFAFAEQDLPTRAVVPEWLTEALTLAAER